MAIDYWSSRHNICYGQGKVLGSAVLYHSYIYGYAGSLSGYTIRLYYMAI